jgi:hypothetical protein
VLFRSVVQLGTFFLIFILYLQLQKLVAMILPDPDSLHPRHEGVAAYFLIAGATAWILFQGYALLTSARRSGTKAESALAKRGKKAYAFAVIVPLLVLAFVGALTWGYFIFLDVLDLVGISAPSWRLVVYIVLGAMLIFTIFPTLTAITTRRRRRQKIYENLVIQLTNFFMFPYILFNITIFYILPKTSGTGGGSGDSLLSTIFLYADMVVTLILMIMALRSAGSRTGYRFGPLNKHAFIMFIYAALAGQFGIRYLQTRDLLPQMLNNNNIASVFLDGQYLLVDAVVGIIMLFSILAFGSKKFGVYFRVRDSVSRQDHQRIDFIHDYLVEEYARRQAPFLLIEVYEPLATLMKVDRFKAMQLVEKMRATITDIRIEGIKKRYVVLAEEKTIGTAET